MERAGLLVVALRPGNRPKTTRAPSTVLATASIRTVFASHNWTTTLDDYGPPPAVLSTSIIGLSALPGSATPLPQVDMAAGLGKAKSETPHEPSLVSRASCQWILHRTEHELRYCQAGNPVVGGDGGNSPAAILNFD